MTAPSPSPAEARSVPYSPAARVPDWVVFGRLRDRIRTGQHIPTEMYAPDALADYVPALLEAGHTHSEIYRKPRRTQ